MTRKVIEIKYEAFGMSSEEEEEEEEKEEGGGGVSSGLSITGSYFLVDFYFQLDEFLYEITNSNFTRPDILCQFLVARTWEQWLVIRPVGTRQWEDVNWDGTGQRSLINMELGNICRFMHPGIVSVRSCMRVSSS
jgi:hypothetical protein